MTAFSIWNVWHINTVESTLLADYVLRQDLVVKTVAQDYAVRKVLPAQGSFKITDSCWDYHYGRMVKHIWTIISAGGVYSGWGAWSACSVTCGIGVKRRDRSCSKATNGDQGCDGVSSEPAICNDASCGKFKSKHEIADLHWIMYGKIKSDFSKTFIFSRGISCCLF